MFDSIKELVRELLEKDSSGHDFAHTMRVFNNALKIAQGEENVDMEVLKAAVLLHDIAYSQAFFKGEHGNVSAQIAEQILPKYNFSERQITKILQAIRLHSFFCHREKDVPIEVKILRDADRLDAIGYTGIVRAIAYAVNAKKPFLRVLEDQVALEVEDQFETQIGEILARDRLRILKDFIEKLKTDIATS